MARLQYRPRVRRATSRNSAASTGSNNSANSSASNSRSSSPQTVNTGNACPALLSRSNLIVLCTGIALGYVVLPFLLVQYVGFDDVLQKQRHYNMPATAGGGGGGVRGVGAGGDGDGEVAQRQSTSRYMADENDSEEDEEEEDETPPRAPSDGGGEEEAFNGGGDANAIQTQISAHFNLLSTQSVPTATAPFVMKTKKIPDRDRKKILVTGGTGFVGSHLVDKLMMEGHEVIALDNFFTGSRKNVEHWMNHPNFRLIVHDVINPIMLEVDQIYHLACPASPPHYQYNPVKTIKTSTMGTLNMLGLAKRVKARVLLASTSEIYGDPEVHPQHESYWGNVNTIGPRSCYDEGKRVAETMMYSYRDQSNVSVRVARIFNTFGPRMHPNDGRVVSNFIIQSLQNRDMTIYGDGKQTRSFQYVSDLVAGLYALMNGDYDLPVNLGNPDEYSVKDFATYIRDLTESKSEIQQLPKQRDDPSQRRPDISTAKKELGWAPKVKVKDGLAKTIQYFQRVLKDEGKIIPTGPGAAKPVA